MDAPRVACRAPGKLVVLGEYAVLNGAPAMVLAVDRYCRAAIGPSPDARCHLTSRTGEERVISFEPGAGSGFAVVDAVVRSRPPVRPWSGVLDSGELFAGRVKLGLGSSAAALTAWAGAWSAFAGRGKAPEAAALGVLVDLHRAMQGGAGSGADVAASLLGGVIRFQLDARGAPRARTVRLPEGVGFAGVFPGSAAATPDYLARYRAWRAQAPGEAAVLHSVLAETAERGIGAAGADDAQGFLNAVAEYGRHLQRLGARIGVDVVTPAHRGVMRQAKRLGIAYKVSGAGGGDLGLAFSADIEALQRLKGALDGTCDVYEFGIDTSGLSMETVST